MRSAYRSRKPRKRIEEFLDLAEKTMKDMAESLKAGFFPANYESAMCRFCEFFVICRKREGYRDDPENEDVRGYGDDS